MPISQPAAEPGARPVARGEPRLAVADERNRHPGMLRRVQPVERVAGGEELLQRLRPVRRATSGPPSWRASRAPAAGSAASSAAAPPVAFPPPAPPPGLPPEPPASAAFLTTMPVGTWSCELLAASNARTVIVWLPSARARVSTGMLRSFTVEQGCFVHHAQRDGSVRKSARPIGAGSAVDIDRDAGDPRGVCRQVDDDWLDPGMRARARHQAGLGEDHRGLVVVANGHDRAEDAD